MSSLKYQLAHNGYNSEELFCHKANQERIEKLRDKKKSHLTLVHSSSSTVKDGDSGKNRQDKFAEDSGGKLKKTA